MRTAAKADKACSPPKKTRRPALKQSDVARVQLGIRVSVPWKDWLDDFAFQERVRPVDIVDAAIMAYAKTRGYKKTPPSLR